jgi:hypothetical protein
MSWRRKGISQNAYRIDRDLQLKGRRNWAVGKGLFEPGHRLSLRRQMTQCGVESAGAFGLLAVRISVSVGATTWHRGRRHRRLFYCKRETSTAEAPDTRSTSRFEISRRTHCQRLRASVRVHRRITCCNLDVLCTSGRAPEAPPRRHCVASARVEIPGPGASLRVSLPLRPRCDISVSSHHPKIPPMHGP